MGNSIINKVFTTRQQVTNLSKEEAEIRIIIKYWIRKSNIKLGWIQEFDKFIANYAAKLLMIDTFCLSSKLLKTLTGHKPAVMSIDYSTFDNNELLCSGSENGIVCVWNIENNKQIESFHRHSDYTYVKFSQYHYHNNNRIVICSSSWDNTIIFWDVKDNQQLQILNERTGNIEFSSFSGGRYLCSASGENIRLWDVETYKSSHVFNGHKGNVDCVNISPLQSNNNNNIGVIGGNGYTICSGSYDTTIRMWDIETNKQFMIFDGHRFSVKSVKYGSNELVNTILSGSDDNSIRLWDIRSGRQIQIFNKHLNVVSVVEYSPFMVNNDEINCYSNVICSGSWDNTIRFWDIRSNKNQLHMITGDTEDVGIFCLKFVLLKKKDNNAQTRLKLYFGSYGGNIRVWG
ncbi:WD repeat-containing protein [Reticulomyxa filosa]|uniref:WD repeat-containing protein n=1 Tax=Reticulomyxa filosa TaxID=46433 RepID=X6LZ26_RETFI|nr:WD repeat-containing protein [Reticulomyxa filosa]|eukprot:ETO06377.1 WD repeat-containing protein [Reticulomyxa filosa]